MTTSQNMRRVSISGSQPIPILLTDQVPPSDVPVKKRPSESDVVPVPVTKPADGCDCCGRSKVKVAVDSCDLDDDDPRDMRLDPSKFTGPDFTPRSYAKKPNTLYPYDQHKGETYSTSSTWGEVTIRKAGAGIGALEPQTLMDMLDAAVARSAEKVAFMAERPVPPKSEPESLPPNQWRTWTILDFEVMIKKIASAILPHVEQFQGFTIHGFNSPEWVCASLAGIYTGAHCCGVFPSDTPDQVVYKVTHSDTTVIFLDCTTDFDKLDFMEKRIEDMMSMQVIIIWGTTKAPKPYLEREDGSKVEIWTWNQALKKGEEAIAAPKTPATVTNTNAATIEKSDAANGEKSDPENRSGADDADKADGGAANGTVTGNTVEDLEERRKKVKPGHCACLVYTSGTTGWPKAVMLSHDNLTFSGLVAVSQECGSFADLGTGGDERLLSFLPCSHIAGFMSDIVFPLVTLSTPHHPGGCIVHFARHYDLKSGLLGMRIKFVKPTILLSVPRVYEKIHEKFVELSSKAPAAKKWALAKSQKAMLKKKRTFQAHQLDDTNQKGQIDQILRNGFWNKKTDGFWDKKISSKVREKLGLQYCRHSLSGAAPINKETLEFFGSIGLNIIQGYGMSESTGLTAASVLWRYKWGSVGFALPGTEVSIRRTQEDGTTTTECPRAKDIANSHALPEEYQGEICFRGRHIMMGYLANAELGEDHVKQMEDQNRNTIDDCGWLHSGDKGAMDENGFIVITGRYKEILIGAGGENIAPLPIEEAVRLANPAISNCIVIGDGRKYNVMLVTLRTIGATGEFPGTDDLLPQAQYKGIAKLSEAIESKVYREYVQAAITKVNNDAKVCLNANWKIQKFLIMNSDFSIVGGEFTPTLKLKRAFVAQKYHDEIEGLYK